MTTPRPIRVLLVEDHPADISLTRKAFGRLATPVQLDVVLDGKEAMKFLRREGKFDGVKRPDLILLDLNMPRMDGREVLREMGKDKDLRVIPIIILTTSAADSDVTEAYSLCANSYLVKPVGFDDFLQLIELVETYWLKTALLPK